MCLPRWNIRHEGVAGTLTYSPVRSVLSGDIHKIFSRDSGRSLKTTCSMIP